MLIVYFGKQPIIDFYTSDEEVQSAILPAWNILTIFVFFDCMQGVAAGNISGLGLMSKVKWVTTIDYWVVGIPLSCLLMFKYDMALTGLWYGPTAACALNYIFYELKIRNSDWQQIADDF